MTTRKRWTAADWNAAHPVGTPVIYRPIRGRDAGMCWTATRSEAWDLGDGTPVVSVKGRTGGVSLEHLTVLSPERGER